MVPSSNLETEECDSLTPADLHVGTSVIWRFKGVPYDAEILQVYGKLYSYDGYVVPVPMCMVVLGSFEV